MLRYILLYKLTFYAAVIGFGFQSHALDIDGYRVTGPLSHENLSIYFVHGSSQKGAVPLTLGEAMSKKNVRVYETGDVNELSIENTSDHEVFVQSGDIVKGGKQDRVLKVSLILPPHSGRIPIASFCVEQGRWAARGKEDLKQFASSNFAAPSRKLKLAMKAPMAQAEPVQSQIGGLVEPTANVAERATGTRQYKVWDNIKKTQEKLSRNVGAEVSSDSSASSLQLALENKKLEEIKTKYTKALRDGGNKSGDIIGIAFAINGKLNSADLYPSNGLFKKMWPKLLQASVTEAISEKDEKTSAKPPTVDDIKNFLAQKNRTKVKSTNITSHVQLETSDNEKAFYFATKRKNGDWIHQNYLTK